MGASQRLEERRLEFREGLVRLVETEGSAIIYDWARMPDRQDVSELEDALASLAVTLLAD